MNNFDDESNILDYYRTGYDPREVYLLAANAASESIAAWIVDESIWLDSSGKDAPPPDFHSPQHSLMMEVMRVDDHAYKNKKGKVVNPTNMRESQLQRELEQAGIHEIAPNLQQVFCNAVTDLPTHEDHNYTFYRKNFVRAVEKHIEKIPLYRKNHPGHKLIFFVMDESTAYLQAESEQHIRDFVVPGQCTSGYPHQHWKDRAFLSPFVDADVDYLVWYTPFKHMQIDGGGVLPLPTTCLFDLKNDKLELEEYNEDMMVSFVA